MANVQIKDLDIVLGGITILDSMNLDVEEGEFLVLLGPSGCGKSTLLHSIAGFNEVAAGSITIGDRDVTWADPKDRDIGMVFQSYALYPTMNVERNMSFGLRVAGVAADEIARRVKKTSAMLHLDELLQRRPSQLSGGQRQRVAIGRALVRDAKVFLFDEPLSNLDAKLRSELRRELKQLHHQLAATIIYVTHDQVEAMTLADRIAVMRKGVIQQIGSPDEIYNHPANLFVAGFLGSPTMNTLPGVIEQREGRTRFVGDALAAVLDGYPGAPTLKPLPAVLGVRPEQIELAHEAGDATPHPARVVLVEPLGAQVVIWFEAQGRHTLSAIVDAPWHGKVGETVHFGFDAASASLFDAASELRL